MQKYAIKRYILTGVLITRAHEDPRAAHGGQIKTLELLRRQYYLPGMTVRVRDYMLMLIAFILC